MSRKFPFLYDVGAGPRIVATLLRNLRPNGVSLVLVATFLRDRSTPFAPALHPWPKMLLKINLRDITSLGGRKESHRRNIDCEHPTTRSQHRCSQAFCWENALTTYGTPHQASKKKAARPGRPFFRQVKRRSPLQLGAENPQRLGFQTLYVDELTLPPVPVQFVWKNWPRGLSVRS